MVRLFDDATEREIVEFYLKPGATLVSVGMLFKCSDSTVKDILKRHGVARWPRGPRKKPTRDVRLFKDHLQGVPVSTLAIKYRLHPTRVCAILTGIQPDRVRMSGNRYWRAV